MDLSMSCTQLVMEKSYKPQENEKRTKQQSVEFNLFYLSENNPIRQNKNKNNNGTLK